jgi:hypothetical protein
MGNQNSKISSGLTFGNVSWCCLRNAGLNGAHFCQHGLTLWKFYNSGHSFCKFMSPSFNQHSKFKEKLAPK